MLTIKKLLRSIQGQAIVEMGLVMPMLIFLGLGAIEFGNMINAYLVLTHLTREGANLTSRERNTVGTSPWATDVNSDLNSVINAANPVIKTSAPGQYVVIYSMIFWDTSATGPCGDFLNDGLNTPDRYRIQRSAPVAVNWTSGSLSQSSQIGGDGTCASLGPLGSSILAMPAQHRLHVVEVFYDYGPSKLTPIQNFIGNFLPAIFYTRTIFTDVAG